MPCEWLDCDDRDGKRVGGADDITASGLYF